MQKELPVALPLGPTDVRRHNDHRALAWEPTSLAASSPDRATQVTSARVQICDGLCLS